MKGETLRYRRREFLGVCAAVPFVADLASAVEPSDSTTTPSPLVSLQVPKVPEADLAREVEALLKLVDPHVLYRPVSVAHDKNAWPIWQQAIETYIEEPGDNEFQEGIEKFVDNRPGLAHDVRQRILTWLQENKECRTITDRGIACGAIDLPRDTKTFRLSMATEKAMKIRSLARLKKYASCAHLQRGEIDSALKEAISILQMGTMLVRSECLVVDYLISQATLGIGVHAIYQVAMDPAASDDLRKACIERLATVHANREDLARAYRVEFCLWLVPIIAELGSASNPIELATRHVVGEMSLDPKPTEEWTQEVKRSVWQTATLLEGHPNPFDKEATVRLGNRFNARFLEDLSKPWLDRDHNLLNDLQKELSVWPTEVDPNLWMLLGISADNPNPPRKLSEHDLTQARDALRKVDNPLGKRTIAEGSAYTSSVMEIYQARLESRRIRIALRLYEKQHGRLPAQLDDLVADQQLPEVPRDPYDGERFRYSRERRVLWCVGQEGTNRGIIPETEDPENPFNDDIEMTWLLTKP